MANFIDDKPQTTRQLFNKRLTYRLLPTNYINIVDFNFAEKYLYGRVDRFNVPIAARATVGGAPPGTGIKRFAPSHLKPGETPLGALPFVVDAFSAMAQRMEWCALKGQISDDDPFLSNLKIYKAYEDPKRRYQTYIRDYFEALAGQFKADNIRVENFDHFIKELMVYISRSILTYPLTFSGYVKSRRCPPTCSGLVVEIADLNPANDEEKVKQFWENRNWDFFVNICNTYGFMIDQLIPWRLVADIDSPALKQYGAPYGMTTVDSVLGRAYMPAHLVFYEEFKYLLLRLYNMIKFKRFVKREEQVLDNGSGCGVTTRIIYPETYTKQQLKDLYSNTYFLNLYCKIRFLEEETSPEEYDQEILIDDCIEVMHSKDIWTALDAFERIINKPFDYHSSLSYIIESNNKAAAHTDEAADRASDTNDISGY